MKERFVRNILRILLLGVLWTAFPSVVLAQTATTTQPTDATQQQDTKKKKKKEVVAIADFTQGFEIRSGLRHELKVRTPEQDSLEAVDLSRLIDSWLWHERTLWRRTPPQ